MATSSIDPITVRTKKSTITLRELADIDESAGSTTRFDNIRNNQILVSLVNINRPKTFSFHYISDILQGGNGVTISTDTNGVTTVSAKLDDLEPLMIAYAVAL
jgi:hypothetical protein